MTGVSIIRMTLHVSVFWNESKMFDDPQESPVCYHFKERFRSTLYDDG